MVQREKVEFETPAGWRVYTIREDSAPVDMVAYKRRVNYERITTSSFPEAGDRIMVEDWGPDDRGPVRQVILLRLVRDGICGWVEDGGGGELVV